MPSSRAKDASPAAAAPGAAQGTNGGDGADAGPAAEPQAVRGGLAETGSGLGLWPAAAGGVLIAGGCVLLIRSGRRSP
ncbi:hypothetical protein [Streptomyces sp. WG7]|uniref:hypothetical protein n=1 Tax=Streptomyces sp. WG7 TaxID=3417650 RepID=UPI003CF837B2